MSLERPTQDEAQGGGVDILGVRLVEVDLGLGAQAADGARQHPSRRPRRRDGCSGGRCKGPTEPDSKDELLHEIEAPADLQIHEVDRGVELELAVLSGAGGGAKCR